MKKICIITGAHLCRNPRVVKEAKTLADAGYELCVITVWTHKTWLDIDRSFIDPQIRYQGIDLTGTRPWKKLLARVKRRIFIELKRTFNLETAFSLNYNLTELYQIARREKADLYIGHQETGLIIGGWLLKQGSNVAFDLEDWYSQDLLPEARKAVPLKLLERYERFAFKRGRYLATTSQIMANTMASHFNASPPKVVRNVFLDPVPNGNSPRFIDRKDQSRCSIFWLSQTIGPGRGLEDLIQALNQLPELKLDIHLRGNSVDGYQQTLTAQLVHKDQHQLYFHEPVSPIELPHRIGEHDIGLALEQSSPPSRDLTITNKIMHYLQCGLAVIASDTQGQREVAEAAQGAVFLYPNHQIEKLSEQIRELCQDKKRLQEIKTKAKEVFYRQFNWELESDKLLQLVHQSI